MALTIFNAPMGSSAQNRTWLHAGTRSIPLAPTSRRTLIMFAILVWHVHAVDSETEVFA